MRHIHFNKGRTLSGRVCAQSTQTPFGGASLDSRITLWKPLSWSTRPSGVLDDIMSLALFELRRRTPTSSNSLMRNRYLVALCIHLGQDSSVFTSLT